MNDEPTLNVIFFHTNSGRAPVQQWLRGLEKADRKAIGEDIRLVQFRWPLGMPVVRKIEEQLWEIRSHLSGRRIARILFTVRNNKMILLHSFIKKISKNPTERFEFGSESKKIMAKWRIFV